ncbi:unnamed protein product [Symbiodinium sp. KB8]|nr:unnamed protein product [Symbiodinium sp. KB8]
MEGAQGSPQFSAMHYAGAVPEFRTETGHPSSDWAASLPQLPPSPAGPTPGRTPRASPPSGGRVESAEQLAPVTPAAAEASAPAESAQGGQSNGNAGATQVRSVADLFAPMTPPRIPRGRGTDAHSTQGLHMGGGGDSAPPSPSTPRLPSSLVQAAAAEAGHEVVRLVAGGMEVDHTNFDRFKAQHDPSMPIAVSGPAPCSGQWPLRISRPDTLTPPFPVSFNRMSVSARAASSMVVNFVDFEGENGTAAPIMAKARSLSPMVSSRFQAVHEHFPKLAYTTSDIVVVVCREPFYNRRYLERCLEFAKRANAGVTNVDRPALVLLGNKLPGEEVEEDVSVSTDQFFAAWGEDARVLDSYFSAVVCLYVPHKANMWRREDGSIVDGAVVFERQILKLRHILQQLAVKRLRRSRALMAGAGAGGGDALDDHGAQTDRDLDVFMTFIAHMRPPRALSASAPRFNEDVILRFDALRSLVLSTTTRLLAARLRRIDAGLLVESKVKAYVRRTASAVVEILEGLAPCVAELDTAASGLAPTSRPDEPVLCLEEARVHGKGAHRCSRRVSPSGTASVWSRILSRTPYNATWPGHFQPPQLQSLTLDGVAEEVWAAVHMDDGAFLEALQLLQTQGAAGSSRVSLGFVHGVFDGVHRFCPIRPDVAQRLNLMGALPASQDLPYCIGCGCKVSGEVGAATTVAGDQHVGGSDSPNAPTTPSSWLGSMLAAVGLQSAAPAASTTAAPTRADTAAAAALEESLAQSLAEDDAAGEVAAALQTDRRMAGSVSFAADLESGSSSKTSAVTADGSRRGGLAGKALAASPPAVQYVWLGLCGVCWHAVQPGESLDVAAEAVQGDCVGGIEDR